MGIDVDQRFEGDSGWYAALAALDWQVELGLTDVISEVPVDRFALPEALPRSELQSHTRPEAIVSRDVVAPQIVHRETRADPGAALALAVEAAKAAARAAGSLEALRAAMAGYLHCDLRRGARNLVFADGRAGARVLILGEAPVREEDVEGRPFVGEAGQLLDRMFASIGLARDAPDLRAALYITSVLPWRPPGDRTAGADEVAMMRPFVLQHIALAAPEVIVVMGNTAFFALTGEQGILTAQRHGTEALGLPVLQMTHPTQLLRNPAAKREAWADLLALRARLEGGA